MKGFSGGSVVKNPPAMQEMWLPSLGWEDPLEKDMATLSSTVVWEMTGASLVAQLAKNPPARQETWVPSWFVKSLWSRERLPLQYSGLENSMDCIELFNFSFFSISG